MLLEQPIKKINFFHYPRVPPGNHPLTKKPEDSGYEIGDEHDVGQNMFHRLARA